MFGNHRRAMFLPFKRTVVPKMGQNVLFMTPLCGFWVILTYGGSLNKTFDMSLG